MADLFDILSDVRDELPGCRLTSIVNMQSGMQLASVADIEAHMAEGADAFQSELYRAIQSALPAFNVDGELEALVLDADETTFISEPVPGTEYFWHVATDSSTTLGFTQAIMRKFRDDIAEGVQSLTG